jgi:hypothetical protein
LRSPAAAASRRPQIKEATKKKKKKKKKEGKARYVGENRKKTINNRKQSGVHLTTHLPSLLSPFRSLSTFIHLLSLP